MSDPFETLHVEATFELASEFLAERHRELSLALHPDRHAGKSASERRASLSSAIEVNAAYRQLRDPLQRAEALLERYGVKPEEGREPPADPAFLMEILELRETLGDAAKRRDRATVDRLVAEQKLEEQKAIAELATRFRGYSSGDDARELLVTLGRLRYLKRFFTEAEAWIDDWD